MPPKPDFFIIGAPRCGTTALSEYLRAHPQIGFSIPKEPNFFVTDMPKMRFVSKESVYLTACFGHLEGGDYAAIGEASVWYLYSTEAIGQVLQFSPHAKIIVMVRNPLDMVQALYEKYIESLQEDCSTFEEAWNLQDQRKQGKHVPKHCRHISLLMYKDVASVGAQLERVMKAVPKDQLKVILFDDFIKDTAAVYRDVLGFLNVPDDGRDMFPRINEGQHVKLRWLYQEISEPNPVLMRVVTAIKKVMGIERLNIQPRLRQLFLGQRSKKADISSQVRTEMREHFADDIRVLEKILNRDLQHWLVR